MLSDSRNRQHRSDVVPPVAAPHRKVGRVRRKIAEACGWQKKHQPVKNGALIGGIWTKQIQHGASQRYQRTGEYEWTISNNNHANNAI